MSFRKVESDSFGISGRHYFATKTKFIYGDTTSKGVEVLFGYCSIFEIINTMTVSDNTNAARGMGDYLRNLIERT